MYEQDIIFGPLTFKQFIVLSIGTAFTYLLYKYYNNDMYLGLTVLATIYLTFFRFKNNKIPLDKLDDYFKQKKMEIGPDDYSKMIKMKIASLESYIEARKLRGLIAADSENTILEFLKKLESELEG